MAHFAKISEDNIVLQVLAFNNSDMLDANGQPSELVGQQYLQTHNHWPAHLWIQTSYNTYGNKHNLGGTPFRGNFAGIGYIWDVENQIFWPQKIYSSWVKNITEARWQSPIGDPIRKLSTEEIIQRFTWKWNENNQVWELFNSEGNIINP
jgi:hypothetical protein